MRPAKPPARAPHRERAYGAWSVGCGLDSPGRLQRAFRAPGFAEVWAHSTPTPPLPPTAVQTVGDGRKGWTSAPSAARPPKPRPWYLAACSARSASRANWSVPKKSTRQGGFFRTRAPRPSSTPGDPQSLASARHWGLGLRPAPPPPPGKGPQQRLTSTLIASAGRPTPRRRAALTELAVLEGGTWEG